MNIEYFKNMVSYREHSKSSTRYFPKNIQQLRGGSKFNQIAFFYYLRLSLCCCWWYKCTSYSRYMVLVGKRIYYWSGFCCFRVSPFLIHLPVGYFVNILGPYTKPLLRTGGAAHSRSNSRVQWTRIFKIPSIIYSSGFFLLYQYSSMWLP